MRTLEQADLVSYLILGSAFLPPGPKSQPPLEVFQIHHILERAAANSYICCPPEVLEILYTASRLSTVDTSDPAVAEEVSQDGAGLIRRARAFDMQSWACDIHSIPHYSKLPMQSRIHVATAHMLATCSYILHALPCVIEVVGSDVPGTLYNALITELASIPEDDPNFKATTWPSFIAGAGATNPDIKVWVMERLQQLAVQVPWGFIYTAMDTLRDLWRLQNEGKTKGSWVQTLRDPDLSFLIV